MPFLYHDIGPVLFAAAIRFLIRQAVGAGLQEAKDLGPIRAGRFQELRRHADGADPTRRDVSRDNRALLIGHHGPREIEREMMNQH